MRSEKIEHKLFATSIFQIMLPKWGIINPKLEEYIYKLKEEDAIGEDRSNYGGWHSKHLPWDQKPISEFITLLDPIVSDLGRSLDWEMENYFLGYSTIWSIINKKRDFNEPHRHGGSILSLAYYVKVPKDNKGGIIYFKDPRIASISRRPMSKPNSHSLLTKTHAAGHHTIEPKEGLLLIFPGWLEHGVKPNESNEDRIVISANINMYPTSIRNDVKEKGTTFPSSIYN